MFGEEMMEPIALDDPRWQSLQTRSGTGERAAQELQRLYENPSDIERFTDLWPYLSSEGTTWSAAYTAAPHILELARRVEGRERFEYLFVLALFRINEAGACPEEFISAYEESLRSALPLLGELATFDFGDETVYYLTAMASLKGLPKLGSLFDVLVDNYECPECGEPISSN